MRLGVHALANNFAKIARFRGSGGQREGCVKMTNLSTDADYGPLSPNLFEGADLLAAQKRAILRSKTRFIRRALG